MATAQLNPVIQSISGSVGRLVFYQRYGKTIMRAHIIPPNPNTPAQSKNRSRFRDAMASWQGLSADEKSAYNVRARKLGITGHNLYISRFMKPEFTLSNNKGGCGDGCSPQVALSNGCSSGGTGAPKKDGIPVFAQSNRVFPSKKVALSCKKQGDMPLQDNFTLSNGTIAEFALSNPVSQGLKVALSDTIQGDMPGCGSFTLSKAFALSIPAPGDGIPGCTCALGTQFALSTMPFRTNPPVETRLIASLQAHRSVTAPSVPVLRLFPAGIQRPHLLIEKQLITSPQGDDSWFDTLLISRLQAPANPV